MIYAVQTGAHNGRPWFKYTTKLRVARMWARRFGSVVVVNPPHAEGGGK